MKKFSFKDSEGAEISFHIDEKYSIVVIGATDSVGLATNAIDVPFNKFRKITDKINDYIDDLYEKSINNGSK